MCPVSLHDAWSIYREYRFASLSRKSQIEYGAAFNRSLHELPAFPTAPEVLRWYNVFLLNKYSIPYANFCLFVLRAVAQCVMQIKDDKTLWQSVIPVRSTREPVRPPKCPPPDFLQRVLLSARNPGEKCFMLLAGIAGLRRNEILGLRLCDYDNETKVIRIVRQRHSDQRKNHKPHSVCLASNPDLLESWEWTISHREEIKPKAGWFKGRTDSFVFPWGMKAVAGILERVRKNLGDDAKTYLPAGWGWHCFRHWGATELSRAGASPVEIQQWLGDSSPDMAMRYVADVRGECNSNLIKITERFNSGKVNRGVQGASHTQHTPKAHFNPTCTLECDVDYKE